MNLQQVKVILEKINRLYDTMELDPQHVDSFEKDLMMSYTRHLYNLISGGQHIEQSGTSNPPKAEPPVRSTPVEEPKSKVAPPPSKVEEIEVPAPAEPNVPANKASITEKAPSASSEKQKLVKEEVAHIFEVPRTTDLLDKLNQSRIPDLNKAMGINEKLFTIKELFGGDQKAFETCITTLNGLSNFEEAKAYMSQTVASHYDWASKDKVKKAKNFVKLVWRRYN